MSRIKAQANQPDSWQFAYKCFSDNVSAICSVTNWHASPKTCSVKYTRHDTHPRQVWTDADGSAWGGAMLTYNRLTLNLSGMGKHSLEEGWQPQTQHTISSLVSSQVEQQPSSKLLSTGGSKERTKPYGLLLLFNFYIQSFFPSDFMF